MLTLMFVLGSSLFFIITNPQKAINFYPVLYENTTILNVSVLKAKQSCILIIFFYQFQCEIYQKLLKLSTNLQYVIQVALIRKMFH